MFPGTCIFPPSLLSLFFFFFYSVGVWRRGLEGKERAGSRPLAFPRAPLREGGGLPAWAAICNILRTAGTRAAPVSKPRVRILSAFKEKTGGVSPLISLPLSSFIPCGWAMELAFSGSCCINKIASQQCQNNTIEETVLTCTKIPSLPSGICWQQAGNVIIPANVTLWNTFWDQCTCVWCSLKLLLSRLESIRAGFLESGVI